MFRNRGVIIVLLIILIFPITGYFFWLIQPAKQMNILVLDKTVHDETRNEHNSFFWILHHEKYEKENAESYNPDKDYYGFFPVADSKSREYSIRRIQLEEIDSLTDVLDMIYYTDTYGVYFNEWYKGLKIADRAVKIHGGLNQNDYLLLKNMYQRKKLVLTEFNLYASPTSSLIRLKTEQLLGIHWSGWSGRYFATLDTLRNNDIPQWIIREYKKEHQGEWPFRSSGIVFIGNNNKVVILEKNIHLNIEVPMIVTKEEYSESYKLPEKVHYPFWFDIEKTDDNNEVISNYELFTTSFGDSLLKENNIPRVFPAVIRAKDRPFWYFCGDFADNPVSQFSAYFKGIRIIDILLYNNRIDSRKRFYWTYYVPLVSKIMDNYREKAILNSN